MVTMKAVADKYDSFVDDVAVTVDVFWMLGIELTLFSTSLIGVKLFLVPFNCVLVL